MGGPTTNASKIIFFQVIIFRVIHDFYPKIETGNFLPGLSVPSITCLSFSMLTLEVVSIQKLGHLANAQCERGALIKFIVKEVALIAKCSFKTFFKTTFSEGAFIAILQQ